MRIADKNEIFCVYELFGVVSTNMLLQECYNHCHTPPPSHSQFTMSNGGELWFGEESLHRTFTHQKGKTLSNHLSREPGS